MAEASASNRTDFAGAVSKLARVVVLSPDDIQNLTFLTAEASRAAKREVPRETVLSALLNGAAWDAADGIIYTPKGGW
jgi:hypothetical protein